MKRLLLAVCMTVVIDQARAAVIPMDGDVCQAAMVTVERTAGLPARLLEAIGLVESGRPSERGGSAASWPWTINVAGTGHFYPSKSEAVEAVLAAQAVGVRSIDVGCMQINLLYHPLAFASLDEAFDPATNVRYGAAFLLRLRALTGNWAAAVAAYHSFTPDLGEDYSRRIAAIWPLAAAFALPFQPGHSAASTSAARVRQPDVDPYHVATPEFRAQLAQAAAFRRARDAAMGVNVASVGAAHPPPVRYADAGERFGQSRLRR